MQTRSKCLRDGQWSFKEVTGATIMPGHPPYLGFQKRWWEGKEKEKEKDKKEYTRGRREAIKRRAGISEVSIYEYEIYEWVN